MNQPNLAKIATIQEFGRSPLPRLNSILELLCPGSAAQRSYLIGAGCPPALAPTTDRDGPYDLIVLSPTPAECANVDWLTAAARFIVENLSPDGVLYVLPPPHQSKALSRLVTENNLCIECSVIHHPDWNSSRYLIPLEPEPIEYGFGALVPTSSWRRFGARVVLSMAFGRQRAREFLSHVALVARRPGARRTCEWLFQHNKGTVHKGTWLLSSSWRGVAGGTVVAYSFQAGHKLPKTVVKIATNPIQKAALAKEVANLEQLGPDATRAGASVPQVLCYQEVQGRVMLFESAVQGQVLSTLVAQNPHRLSIYIDSVARWLEQWNQATKQIRALKIEDIDNLLLAPAKCIANQLENGETYLDWLTQRGMQLVGLPLPFVAAHNDLTTTNILRDDSELLGIVDWEAANSMCLPLGDLLYAFTDGVTALPNFGNRFDAFQSCFVTGGVHSEHLQKLIRRSMSVLGLSGEFYDLYLHACWLHHAANEARNAPPGPRTFLQIAQWLACHFQEQVRPGAFEWAH